MKPKREKTVSVRMTNDEYALLEAIAKSSRLNPSDVLRAPLANASSRLSSEYGYEF